MDSTRRAFENVTRGTCWNTANEFSSIMMIDGRFARSNLLKYDNSNIYRRPAKDEAFVISSILIRSIGAEIGKSKLEQRSREIVRARGGSLSRKPLSRVSIVEIRAINRCNGDGLIYHRSVPRADLFATVTSSIPMH